MQIKTKQKSIRLNQYMRRQIVRKILETKVEPKIKEAEKKREKAGDKLYTEVVPADMKKIMNKYDASFTKNNKIRIRFTTEKTEWSYRAEYIHMTKHVPTIGGEINTNKTTKDLKQWPAYNEADKELGKLMDKRWDLSCKIEGILEQIGSSKQLHEAFPEYTELINAVLPSEGKKHTAVVVRTEEVTNCINNFPDCEVNKAKANEKGAGRAIREAKAKAKAEEVK